MMPCRRAQPSSTASGTTPAHLVGREAVTGEARPVGGGFALLDPLLRGPAMVVEADDGAVGLGPEAWGQRHRRPRRGPPGGAVPARGRPPTAPERRSASEAARP